MGIVVSDGHVEGHGAFWELGFVTTIDFHLSKGLWKGFTYRTTVNCKEPKGTPPLYKSVHTHSNKLENPEEAHKANK